MRNSSPRPGDSPLETWWPNARVQVADRLRSMGVPHDDLEDVLQQTALKALGRDFESERHLTAWSVVVARNVVFSDHRRRARLTKAHRLSANPVQDNVEDLAVTRLRNASLMQLISQLPDEQRLALEGNEQGLDRQRAARQALIRHRTRRRLRAMFERLGVVLGETCRRVAEKLGLRLDGAAAPFAAAALGIAALGAASLAAQPDVDARGKAAPISRRKVSERGPVSADTSATAVRSAQTTPEHFTGSPVRGTVISVPLGHNAKGEEWSAGTRPQLPEEDGILFCVGDPGAPNELCVDWPKVVRDLGQAIFAELGLPGTGDL